MFTKSIRWRLQLWLGFLLICILSGFGVTAYQLHRTNQLNQIDQELKRRVEVLSAALRNRSVGSRPTRRPRPSEIEQPSPAGQPIPELGHGRNVILSPQVLSLFDESVGGSFYFVLWSRNGAVVQSSANAPAEVPRPTPPLQGRASLTRSRGPFRESIYFNSLGECALSGRDITADLTALGGFCLWLLAAGAAVLALGLTGGWWLTTRAIRPVEDIIAAASRISAGDLSQRITGADPENELGRLATVLNTTFARLEAAFTQQKQFTADASHELRTPIAVIICEAQTALARERSNAEYKETIEANLAIAQQMRHLTESLLTLARFDAGHEALKCETFDLAERARACVERLRPLSAQHSIRIHCDLSPTTCCADPGRVDQVITNLLANAIHYNRDGGEVRLVTRPENGAAIVTVSDTGLGVAAADVPHVFERFHRADKSRSSSGGHSGLGLSITKAIVDAHGGSIAVSSEVGVGTCFTVRLRSK